MTEETGAVAPTVTPTETGDAVTPAPSETPPTPTGDAAPDPAKEPVKKKPDPQKSELSYLKREMKRQNDRLIGLLEKQLDKPQVIPKTDDPPPKIEQFTNLDDFLNARDAWREKQREKQDTGKEKPTDQPNVEYQRAVQEARDDLMAAGSEKYEDFEEAVTSDKLKITPVMRDAIFQLDESDLQIDVTWYLAQNPKEALRISKLSPMRQVAEIGKLEAKISSQPPPKKPSNAPAPITPVGGVNTGNDEIQDVEDYKSFVRKRNRQLGRK